MGLYRYWFQLFNYSVHNIFSRSTTTNAPSSILQLIHIFISRILTPRYFILDTLANRRYETKILFYLTNKINCLFFINYLFPRSNLYYTSIYFPSRFFLLIDSTTSMIRLIRSANEELRTQCHFFFKDNSLHF